MKFSVDVYYLFRTDDDAQQYVVIVFLCLFSFFETITFQTDEEKKKEITLCMCQRHTSYFLYSLYVTYLTRMKTTLS